MKTKILAALAIGCAAGWTLCSASGCVFGYMALARADGASPAAGVVVSAPCNVQGPGGTYAVLAFDGRAKEDIAANVYTIATPHDVQVSPMGTLMLGATTYPGVVLKSTRAGDGSAAILCEQGETAAQFYVRQ